VTSTSGGHTSARDDFDDIVVSKLTDLSTPLLLQHCAMGKTIPKAKFEMFRADGNGEWVKYFEIILENVLIGSMKPGCLYRQVRNESYRDGDRRRGHQVGTTGLTGGFGSLLLRWGGNR
jgi:type VI secretion system secreted protein Hcp